MAVDDSSRGCIDQSGLRVLGMICWVQDGLIEPLVDPAEEL